MRWMLMLLPFWLVPGLVVAAERDAGDSAITILLVLGLAAIIVGLGSLSDLRGKHMLPPRPRRPRNKADHGDPTTRPKPQ